MSPAEGRLTEADAALEPLPQRAPNSCWSAVCPQQAADTPWHVRRCPHLRDEVLAQDAPGSGLRHQVIIRDAGVGADDAVQAASRPQRARDRPRVHIRDAQHPLRQQGRG